MDLLFIGTGAADYEKAFSCTCQTCATVRARGGANLRHYSSLLLNGNVLIDCGPTAAWRLAELDVPPTQVEAVVFTHSHEDHCDPEAMASLIVARGAERGPLPIHGNEPTLTRLAEVEGLQPHLVAPGTTVEIAGLHLLAVAANHIIDVEETLNYVISDGDTRLLYATDTGWPLEKTWEALTAVQPTAVVAEATFGLLQGPDLPPGYLTYHLNWWEFLRLRDEMIGVSMIGAETPFVATHISQHHAPPHEQFVNNALPPVMVAYDGLSLRV